MTDFGRRAGQGDMLKSVYDPNEDGVIAVAQTEADMTRAVYDPNLNGIIAVAQTEADMTQAVFVPILTAFDAALANHHSQHEDAGTDEISLAGLTPPAHKATHEDGGSDEIDTTGLIGHIVRAILGDATQGRQLRAGRIIVKDGTDANTLNVTYQDNWNSSDVAELDNLGRGDENNNWDYDAAGKILDFHTIPQGGFCQWVVGTLYRNYSTTFRVPAIYEAGNRVRMALPENPGATLEIWEDIVDTGRIIMDFVYITAA